MAARRRGRAAGATAPAQVQRQAVRWAGWCAPRAQSRPKVAQSRPATSPRPPSPPRRHTCRRRRERGRGSPPPVGAPLESADAAIRMLVGLMSKWTSDAGHASCSTASASIIYRAAARGRIHHHPAEAAYRSRTAGRAQQRRGRRERAEREREAVGEPPLGRRHSELRLDVERSGSAQRAAPPRGCRPRCITRGARAPRLGCARASRSPRKRASSP